MGVCASAGSGGGASESADPIADGESKLLAELRHMWSDSGGSVVIDIPRLARVLSVWTFENDVYDRNLVQGAGADLEYAAQQAMSEDERAADEAALSTDGSKHDRNVKHLSAVKAALEALLDAADTDEKKRRKSDVAAALLAEATSSSMGSPKTDRGGADGGGHDNAAEAVANKGGAAAQKGRDLLTAVGIPMESSSRTFRLMCCVNQQMVFPAMAHLMLLLDLHMPILDGRGRDAWVVEISVGGSEIVVSHDRAMRACGGESSPMYFSGRWVLHMHFDVDLRMLRECAVTVSDFTPGKNMDRSVVAAMKARAGASWRADSSGAAAAGSCAPASPTTSGGGAARTRVDSAATRETMTGEIAAVLPAGKRRSGAAAKADAALPPRSPVAG